MLRIAVFCGSRAGADPAYAEPAAVLGRLLARRRCHVRIVGGMHERKALMASLADAVLHASLRVPTDPEPLLDGLLSGTRELA